MAIPFKLHEVQILFVAAAFVMGCLSIFLGMLVLLTRGYSSEVKALASHTARLGNKGVTDEATALVSSASELITSLNQLVRTASGVGTFLLLAGMTMIAASYWVVTQIQWPA
jgi:hypothetical protein